MAGDWIKMRSNLAGDPRVLKIAAATRLDRFAVVGRLHAVWSWAGEHTVDGRLVGATVAFIDELIGKRGFGAAMAAPGVAWLVVDAQGISVPRWEEHNSKAAKERAESNARVARHRVKGNARTVTNVTQFPAPTGQDVTPEPLPIPFQKPLPEKSKKEEEEERAPHGAVGPIRDLQALRRRWPDLDIDQQMAAASRHCLAKYGRPDFDAKWFEATWLKNAASRLQGDLSTPAAGQPGATALPGREVDRGPEGWRVWLDDNCPGSVYAKGAAMEDREWHELDRTTREFIANGMGWKPAATTA